MLFEEDGQLYDVNVGAQGRAPSLIAAPAVIWQRGFWRPDCRDETPEAGDQPAADGGTTPDASGQRKSLDEAQWRRQVDHLLLKLFLELERRRDKFNGERIGGRADEERRPLAEPVTAVCPNLDDHHLYLFRHRVSLDDLRLDESSRTDEVLRHDSFSYNLNLSGISLIFAAEMHHEYWTLTISADYSHFVETDAGEYAGLVAVGRLIGRLQTMTCQRYNGDPSASSQAMAAGSERVPGSFHVKVNQVDPERRRKEALGLIQNLLIGRFRRWCDEVITASLEDDPEFQLWRCGGMFADFMSLALLVNLAQTKGAHRRRLVVPRPPPPASSTPATDRPLGPEVRGTPFDDNEALTLVDAAWPIIRRFQVDDDAAPGSDEPHPDDDDQRLKRFGKPEFSISRLQGNAVIFSASMGRQFRAIPAQQNAAKSYCFFVSYRSKWRFGRLLDRILSLEMTRLAAVRDLRDVTTASRKLKVESDKIRDYQFDYEGKATLADAEEPTKKALEIADRIRTIAAEVPEGLMYRVEKSRAYAARYDNLLRQLRIESIEGFAEYRRYFARRLFDARDFINRVGRRYEFLGRSAGKLVELESAAAAQRLRRDTRDASKRSSELLDNAELIIIMPLAYYAAYVFGHVFEAGRCGALLDSAWSHVAGVGFAVLVFAAMKASHSERWLRKDHRFPALLGLAIAFLVIAFGFRLRCG